MCINSLQYTMKGDQGSSQSSKLMLFTLLLMIILQDAFCDRMKQADRRDLSYLIGYKEGHPVLDQVQAAINNYRCAGGFETRGEVVVPLSDDHLTTRQTIILFTAILSDSLEKVSFACTLNGFTTEFCSLAAESNFDYLALLKFLREHCFNELFTDYYTVCIALNNIKMAKILRDLSLQFPNLDKYVDSITVAMIEALDAWPSLSDGAIAKLILRHEEYSLLTSVLSTGKISLTKANNIFTYTHFENGDYQREKHRLLQEMDCTALTISNHNRRPRIERDPIAHADKGIILTFLNLKRAGISLENRNFRNVRGLIDKALLKYLILKEHSLSRSHNGLWLPEELSVKIAVLALIANKS